MMDTTSATTSSNGTDSTTHIHNANHTQTHANTQMEESTFALQLQGVFDKAAVLSAIERCDYRLINAHTDQPLVQIGQNMFVAKWHQPFGTDMMFRCDTGAHELRLDGVCDRRLLADKAVLEPNTL